MSKIIPFPPKKLQRLNEDFLSRLISEAHGDSYFSPQTRAQKKAKSREEDAILFNSGRREELNRKNSLFYDFDVKSGPIRFPSPKR